MKDNFSKQAGLYAKFRPAYPQALYDFLLSLTPDRQRAWDCGTGNGQVAAALADHFAEVFATDISENQLKNAEERSNVVYQLAPAEKAPFPDSHFNLITVAQAIHWFDFEAFYAEVNRTLKPGGVLAVFGYSLPRIDPETDKLIDDFYENITGPYWDAERRYIDEEYRTIPFPYADIKMPELASVYDWQLEQLIGYLTTWSAVQHYIDQHQQNPVGLLNESLNACWQKGKAKKVSFPIFGRFGRKLEV